MMLELFKTDITPQMEQRIIRLFLDVHVMQLMSNAEIRAVYKELEAIRDALSRMLDRVDGK